MGSQFAFIYDVVAVVIIIGTFFAGYKRGFASVIVGLLAMAAAFFCASMFSKPISEWFYTEVVEQPLENTVDKAISDAMGNVRLGGLSELDFSAVKIGGVPAEDYTPNYEGTGKAVVDLSDLDLSECGITAEVLSELSLPADTDLRSYNGRTAEFTAADIEQFGMGKLAVAHVAASALQKTSVVEEIAEYTEQVGEALPFIFGNLSQDISSGSVSGLRTVVLNMINAGASVQEAVVEKIIAPQVISTVQTIAFMLIFIVVSAVLGIAAHLLKVVNKIPILGGANAVLGGITGLLEAVLSLMIICLVLRLIISLSDGGIILLNSAAINDTYFFRYFYHMELLDGIIQQ
ncbi:MAG: CvpA family protein [Oscillospiraceae bacterium]